MAISARSFLTLLLGVGLSGCSMFHHEDTAATSGAAGSKKGLSIWPLHQGGPVDATPYLEYQRARETDKSKYALLARNTHQTKAIEGDIRTTIETADNGTKVDSSHFTLAPNETKKLLVYPDTTHLTYEVNAFFKE